MKSEDFKSAPLSIKSLTETVPSVSNLLETELAAAKALADNELIRRVEKLKNNFDYMLRYLVRNDLPDLSTTTDDILKQAERLRKDILLEYNTQNSPRSYYASLRYQRRRPEENSASLVSDYLTELNRRRNDPTAMMSNTANAKLEEISSDIFERFRTEAHIEEQQQLIESMLFDSDIPESDRVLWVGGIGMGLTEEFDDERFALLLKILESGSRMVQVAAAVWLAVSFLYNHDAELYRPDISANAGRNLFISALYEIIRLKTVSEMAEEDRRRIIPGMDEIAKNIKNVRSADDLKDLMKNPGKMADNPEIYQWFESFNTAVREGYDVQASTLGRLRHWNFFGKLSNWLLPYDANHSALAGIADEEGAPLADMLNKISGLIDADKYALILSLSTLPAEMRGAAIQGNMDQMGINSNEVEEALNEEARESAKTKTMISNYAKQVWRVLSTHPRKDEFKPDVDEYWDDNIYSLLPMFNSEQLRNLAKMAFKLKNVDKAILYMEFIQDFTDDDERQRALYSIYTDDEIEAVNLDDYLDTHQNDLELALIAAMNGRSSESVLNVLSQYEVEEAENVRYLRGYVNALEAHSRYDDAVNQLMALEYLDVDNAEQHRRRRIKLLVFAAQWNEALEAAADFNPENSEDAALLAYALWMGNRRTEAINLLEQHKNDPDMSRLLDYVHTSIRKKDLSKQDKALSNYIIDAWYSILNNSNPLNI